MGSDTGNTAVHIICLGTRAPNVDPACSRHTEEPRRLPGSSQRLLAGAAAEGGFGGTDKRYHGRWAGVNGAAAFRGQSAFNDQADEKHIHAEPWIWLPAFQSSLRDSDGRGRAVTATAVNCWAIVTTSLEDWGGRAEKELSAISNQRSAGPGDQSSVVSCRSEDRADKPCHDESRQPRQTSCDAGERAAAGVFICGLCGSA